MATITSAAIGNWSAGATWVGGVAPTTGDTAILAHNVTVDVNVSVGTSPNNSTTAAITLNTGRTLTIAPGVTLTCLGNQSWASGAGLVMGAGSQLVFDNSASGGSPVYRIIGSNTYTLSAVGTSGSPCGISALGGQSWEFFNGASRYIAWSSLTATYCTFTRMGGAQSGFQVFSGTSAFSNCTFANSREVLFFGTSTSATLTVDNCTWTAGNYPSGSAVNLQLSGTLSSGTRRFNGNVLDSGFTYLSRGFTIQGNYFRGILPLANSAYTWASFRLNFVHGTGNENGGNGQNVLNDVIRNYWVIDDANPHFISATALQTSTNTLIAQNVFESQGTDTVDTGDCVILNSGATAGTNRIIVRNNITVPAPAGQQTGQLLTIYNNNTSVSEHERNTVNVNDSSSGVGKRAAFAFAEAGNGASGQIAVLKGNLVHGTSASQGFIAERIQGTVNDIITSSGADYNWRFNTSDGDNGRGYTDRGGNNNLWAAGNAAAAGVDNNQGSGDPGFVAVTRTSVSWAVARGYGSAFADVVAAIKAVPSRTADLINYIFEGNKPSAAGCRNAAHDGACVGAANWHDATRSLTAMQATVTELSTNWLT